MRARSSPRGERASNVEEIMNKCVSLLALCVVFSACNRAKLEPRSAAASIPAPVEPVYKPGPQPTQAELREAIKRNYEDAVTIDNNYAENFLVRSEERRVRERV